MPDGTLLSLPIPTNGCGNDSKYDDLTYKGIKYSELLNQINPKEKYNYCHVDPDIREGIRTVPSDWQPAFGQKDQAQGYLNNSGVETGDIFLFFGNYRRVKLVNGRYRFVRKSNDFYYHSPLQIIYGYLQIGRIIRSLEEIKRFHWHPHSAFTDSSNTLYIPTNRLSLIPSMKGYGTLSYREDRVLTMKDHPKATWNPLPFLFPEYVHGNRKNSAKKDGLYYAGQWQELVFDGSEDLLKWVKTILRESKSTTGIYSVAAPCGVEADEDLQDVEELHDLQEVDDMLEERVSEWKNDYIWQGRKLGREEGIALGREEGMTLGRKEGITLGREEGITLGREEGIVLGREEGIEMVLMDALETRFGVVPQAVSDSLATVTGTEVLRRLVRCAWQVASLEEFLKVLKNEKH
jgi:hypothetical protein